MLRIGITGGIGTGKSAACRLFAERHGIPVYSADDRAKWLMQHHLPLVQALKAAFGEESYLPDGTLNRNHLAKTVFGNPEQLARLNALVHPAVLEDGSEWMRQQAQAGAPYALKEAALLIESSSFRLLDKLIVVTAPLELRLHRAMLRDGVDEATVRARMAHQLPEEEKIKHADFVLDNGGSLEELAAQVDALHGQLLQLQP